MKMVDCQHPPTLNLTIMLLCSYCFLGNIVLHKGFVEARHYNGYNYTLKYNINFNSDHVKNIVFLYYSSRLESVVLKYQNTHNCSVGNMPFSRSSNMLLRAASSSLSFSYSLTQSVSAIGSQSYGNIATDPSASGSFRPARFEIFYFLPCLTRNFSASFDPFETNSTSLESSCYGRFFGVLW